MSSAYKVDWGGIFPALTTRFTDDFAVNHAAMREYIDFQLDGGVHGLVMAGSLGENGSLSANEKQELLKTAVSAAAGRVPVLLTVAETTTQAAIECVQAGQKNGADGFMLLPPMRYHSDDRETLIYLKTVSEASEKPVMIYNNPVAYNIDVTPEMFEILADIPQIAAIKESSAITSRVTDIIARVGERFQILCGVDTLALEAMCLGAHGWLAGLVCAFPKETVAIYDHFKAGRLNKALEIYRWFMPLLHLDVSTKLVQNIKLAEAMAGVGNENVRPPRLPLAGEERERVMGIIRASIENRPSV